MAVTVDSNILLSIFIKDSLYQQSAALLEKYSANEYIINDCIYLELAVHFNRTEKLNEVLDILEVRLLDKLDVNYALLLEAWSSYLKKKSFICPFCKNLIKPVCPECGSIQSFRQRILADFFIGAFAVTNSQGILTLDPAYYRNYFPDLPILD